jgi:hypothetical protein
MWSWIASQPNSTASFSFRRFFGRFTSEKAYQINMSFMVGHRIIKTLVLPAFVGAAITASAVDEEMVPIDIKIPDVFTIVEPSDIILNEHIENPSDKSRPPFMAPKGVTNLALNKSVTSSDASPIKGTLALVTDGNKDLFDEAYVVLHRKVQWVQIDLENPAEIYAIVVWHAHDFPQISKGVVVQVSDDKEFKQEVRTVFNNDYENEDGLGLGTDKQYFENREGRLIDTKGVKARYVRLYSRGSTRAATNFYTEVEVYGLASK